MICQRSTEGDLWKLTGRLDGVERLLGQAQTVEHRSRYRITASVNRGRFALTVDGKKLIETFDRSLAAGAVGLWAQPGQENGPKKSQETQSQQFLARFNGLSVDFHRELKPLLRRQKAFEHESYMSPWADLDSDWMRSGTRSGHSLYWHRGSFPGEAALELKVSRFNGPNSDATLVLNGDGRTAASGYSLQVIRQGQVSGGNEWVVRLYRLQELVASGSVGSAQPSSLRLERTGDLLVGFVDGQALLAWRDEKPLKGDRLGWQVRGVMANRNDVLVSSPNVYQYNFARAPVDWRGFSGIWEVSSRWECDPRWSFFSGRSVEDEVAVLWSKRLFKGDVTVEFYVAPKMENERGASYEYSRDFNCTISADGRDLTSGYSFLLGGFDNTRTCIYRKGEMVGVPSRVVLRREMDFHRRWLHVRVEKKDGTLRFWVQRRLVAQYNDPEPLDGDHIAFWTKGCGLMLAKVVVFCENGTELELPDINLPRTCRSIYDPAVSAMPLGNGAPAINMGADNN